jgi:hypothetical protein
MFHRASSVWVARLQIRRLVAQPLWSFEAHAARRRKAMAKGQMKSNKEARKPKKEKKKTIAANPSREGVVRGLDNMKNS